jgi:hypothetical protein
LGERDVECELVGKETEQKTSRVEAASAGELQALSREEILTGILSAMLYIRLSWLRLAEKRERER